MLNAIKIALSGLNAASKKTEAVASNIANMHSAGSLNGKGQAPYQPLDVAQSAVAGGVKSEFTGRKPAFTPSYDPDSPLANKDGLIGAPNVDLAEEAVNMMMAEAAFKASLKVMQTAADMEDEALKMFDREV